MSRKKSKSADLAAPEQEASILEAKLEVGSRGAPRSPTRANRTVRKSTGKQGAIRKTTTTRKSNPASIPELEQVRAAELAAPDQTFERTAAEVASSNQTCLTVETSIRERIALLAYSYWQTRGCQGGSPEEDWFRAERELLENLGQTSKGTVSG